MTDALRHQYAKAMAEAAGSRAFHNDDRAWDHMRAAWYRNADAVLAIRDTEIERMKNLVAPSSEPGHAVRTADRLTTTLREVLDAFERYWARASYDGPVSDAVRPEQFAAWRRTIMPMTDAEADAELDRRLQALKEQP